MRTERCKTLRYDGNMIHLKVMLLHEHTFERFDHEENAIDLQQFISNFRRKSDLRKALEQEIRAMVSGTAQSFDELKILEAVQTLRSYVESVYESIHQNTVNSVERPSAAAETLWELTELDRHDAEIINHNCAVLEEFGGLLVFVDVLLAEDRLRRLGNQDREVLEFLKPIIMITKGYLVPYPEENFLQVFLEYSTLSQIVTDLMSIAYDANNVAFIGECAELLRLLILIPDTYTELVEILTRTVINLELPRGEVQSNVVFLLCQLIHADSRNLLCFGEIDGSIEAVISRIEPSRCWEDKKWFEQICVSVTAAVYDTANFVAKYRELFPVAAEKVTRALRSASVSSVLMHYRDLDAQSRFERDIRSAARGVLWMI